ncbi:MAG TPA: hypothetical protein EYP73_02645, partial [Acidimicrobiia bacterium]|nr:hypothetical protein [Acidimicrobiia bacterium]
MLRKRVRAAGVAVLLAVAMVVPTAAATPANETTVDVIVVLNAAPGASVAAQNRAAAAAVAADYGLAAKWTYGTALVGFAASVPEARLAALEADPRVAYVDTDDVYTVIGAHTGGAEPQTSNGQTVPWGISRTGADTNPNEGTGIQVYVIDTGIDSDHPDLAANIGNGFAATPCRGRGCNERWDDDHGHGTHVSGTIGAIDNTIGVLGMASEVTLHAVKVCTRAGRCSGSDIIAGIDWVAQDVAANGYGGQAVVNMSLGGGGS